MLCVALAEERRLRSVFRSVSFTRRLYTATRGVIVARTRRIETHLNVWWSHLRKPMPQQRRRRAISGAN